MKRITSGAVQLDADVCNNLEAPARGCDAGAGIHVVIPADWSTRVLASQQVPGCTYYAVDIAGALDVSVAIETALGIPAVVNTLPAGAIRGQAAVLLAKLASAQVLP